MENYLIHYGIPRRSGRYPYGSGKNPKKRERIHTADKYQHYLKTEVQKEIDSDRNFLENDLEKLVGEKYRSSVKDWL